MSTKKVDFIPFTKKEYTRALEKYLNQHIAFYQNRLKDDFEKGYVDIFESEYRITYTQHINKKSYFIYLNGTPITKENFKEPKSKYLDFQMDWPNKYQFERLEELYNPDGSENISFVYSENQVGLKLIEKKNKVWLEPVDFSDNSEPAYVINIVDLDEKLGDTQSEASLLSFLLKNSITPDGFHDQMFTDLSSFINNENVKAVIKDDELRFIIKDVSALSKLITKDVNNEVYKILLDYFLDSNDKNLSVEQLRTYLKNCDSKRINIPEYPELLIKAENEQFWDFWSEEENPEFGYPIPTGQGIVYARNPRDDIKKGSLVAIDFGTSSTVVVKKDTDVPDPVQISVGRELNGVDDPENPTLLLINNYKDFIYSYYSKDYRPNTSWSDLMVSHAVKDRLKEMGEEEFKSTVSHIKQWAAESESRLSIKPKDIDEPKQIETLVKLLKEKDVEDFNPIEIYAYFLGMYINNRQNQHGIYLDYQLSYPATYDTDVKKAIVESFYKGIRKSIPAEIKDEEIHVNADFTEPEAYAITAMERYGFMPKEGNPVKYGIFDFGGGTCDFAYGYWSKLDGSNGQEWRIETADVGGQEDLGGEKLLDGMAYNVFTNAKNLPKMIKGGYNFYYGIEKKQKTGTSDQKYISSDYYSKQNMTTLIEWDGGTGQEGDFGLRKYWENQETYFANYFNNVDRLNNRSIIIADITNLAECISDDTAKQELKILLDEAEKTEGEYERRHLYTEVEAIKHKYKESLDTTTNNDEVSIKIPLYNRDCKQESVDITLSKSGMYKYFSKEIEDGIESFFDGMKKAFDKKGEYKEKINIFLAGNSSKSPIVKKLMLEAINRHKEQSNNQVDFELFDRFDSEEFESNIRKIGTAQGWDEDIIQAKILAETDEKVNKPTGKTGVAFGIIELASNRQIDVLKSEKNEYFKYYLGIPKLMAGMKMFTTISSMSEGKPVIGSTWYEAITVPETNIPGRAELLFTSDLSCTTNNKLVAKVHAQSRSLEYNSIGEGEKIFIKAESNNSIFYTIAKNSDEAPANFLKLIGDKDPKDSPYYIKLD